MTLKKADNEYIIREEKKFLGKAIANFFAEPENQVLGHESIDVELTAPLSKEAYDDWINSAFYNSLCTWDKSPENYVSEMAKKYSVEEKEKLLMNILNERPISVALEGVTFAFRIKGIPRTMTHQIVRHRKMAFGQQSFRVSSCYAEPIRLPQTLIDGEVKNVEELINDYTNAIKQCRSVYKKLIRSGVPMEEARNIMPMGTLTAIGLVTNLRALIEYFASRTSSIAQNEHTYIVALMAKELKLKQPKFFDFIAKKVPNIIKIMEDYL